MLSRVGWKHHVVVAAAAVIVPVLVGIGWIGGGRHPERFDAKQVVVTPAGPDGVRIREIVDQDFGSNDRHGYQRIIPNDFGSPTDIEAFTYDEDIPPELWVSDFGFETQIRIGSPDVTASGQHRFELSYTLPDARVRTGDLALDIIGTDETLETGRFEVVLDGFRLDDPRCNVGEFGDVGGCELVADGDLYRVVFEPLRPGEGITIGGTITDTVEPSGVAEPAMPEHRVDRRLLGAGVLALVGLVTAGVIYVVQARRGRNVVGGASAVDAAHADGGATRLVTDRELESMATTEFEPPRDLHPWEGAILLDEAVSSRSVSAWFAEQIAKDVLVLEDRNGLRLKKGSAWRETDITTMDMVRDLFKSGDDLSLSRYQPTLSKLWERLLRDQRSRAKKAQWWDSEGGRSEPTDLLVGCLLFAPVILVVSIVVGVLGLLASWVVCGLLTSATSAVAAVGAYSVLLARRSAQGSALALRTESFRRFLAASEGQHVDWAWERGVVREYTAWAVALGAAAAWGRAIDKSAVAPQVNQMLVTPALFERQLASIESARTPPPPPSTGGSSSGGSSWSSSSSSSFSSGSVGGGGGGGSSGSW